jgi:PhnB protein
MFWGDRFGKLRDPFGHEWAVATHVEDVAPAEMGRRMAEAMKSMSPPPAQEPRPDDDEPPEAA